MLNRTPDPQVATLENLLQIATTKPRTEVCAAIQAEIAKLTGTLFEFEPAKPLIDVEAKFTEFKAVYPKRKGDAAWSHARKLFQQAIKRGWSADEIIAGARGFAIAEKQNVGTCYIPQSVKWLRHERWLDYTQQGKPLVPVDPKEARRLQAIEELRGIL